MTLYVSAAPSLSQAGQKQKIKKGQLRGNEGHVLVAGGHRRKVCGFQIFCLEPCPVFQSFSSSFKGEPNGTFVGC